MPSALPFRRVAILGTGLIGGSFGLALRRHFPEIRVAGFDRDDVLKRALARDALHESATTIKDAVLGADLVYIAMPMAATIDAFPIVAAVAAPGTLVTDACGAKALVCKQGAAFFKTAARFLGGHPMAGKEISGIDQADANLFARAPYALIGNGSDPDPRLQNFVELIRAIGAEPVWCDADTHDWAVGIVSHLPQLVAVALARVVSDETDETGLPLALAGKGLQDMLRVAGSPYGVWRDVLVANRENVARALERLTQEIEHLRRNLSARELEEEFRAANTLYSRLRAEPDKCEG